MPNQYCVECDKEFKSLTGFNGHNQWKHQIRPGELVSNSPTGRTTEMLEKLSDRTGRTTEVLELIVGRLEDLQMEIRSLRADNNGNGNGNGNGNNRGNNSPSDEPIGIAVQAGDEPELTYICNDCEDENNYGQKRCGGCGKRLLWDGVDR